MNTFYVEYVLDEKERDRDRERKMLEEMPLR